jgi:hypothetical protein
VLYGQNWHLETSNSSMQTHGSHLYWLSRLEQPSQHERSRLPHRQLGERMCENGRTGRCRRLPAGQFIFYMGPSKKITWVLFWLSSNELMGLVGSSPNPLRAAKTSLLCVGFAPARLAYCIRSTARRCWLTFGDPVQFVGSETTSFELVYTWDETILLPVSAGSPLFPPIPFFSRLPRPLSPDYCKPRRKRGMWATSTCIWFSAREKGLFPFSHFSFVGRH